MPTSILFLTGIVAVAGLDREVLAAQEVDRSDALGARIEAIVNEARDRLGLDGVSLTALVGDQELVSAGYGRFDGHPAEADKKLPAGPTIELLLIGSALELANEKGLALDTKVTALFPERELPFGSVTLLSLLTHTSGLALVPEDVAVEAAAPKGDAPAEGEAQKPVDAPWLAWLREATPRADPNTCVLWSNADLLLLELWLEENGALGRIAEHSGELEADEAAKWLPISREHGLGHLESGALPARLAGSKATLSSSDVAQLLRSLLKEDQMGPESSAQLMQELRLKDGTRSGRTVGFAVTSLGEYEGFSFGGAVGETSVHGAYYPELDLFLALSGQGAATSLVALKRSLARALFDLEQPVLSDLPMSAEELELLVGTYQIGCDTLTLSVREGRLQLVSTELNLSFAYQGGGRFHALGGDEVELEFQTRGQGPAESFILFSAGHQAIARRFR
jgi:Beta-lactamase